MANSQTDRQTHRQVGRQTHRDRTDGHAARYTYRQIDRRRTDTGDTDRKATTSTSATAQYLQAFNGLSQFSDHLYALSCFVLLGHHALLQDQG